MSQTDVLVVGAGPIGLTVACLLRRRGIDCRVIDKADGPSRTSKALGLQHRASEILAMLGAADSFAAEAAAQTFVEVCADGRRLARLALQRLPTRSDRAAFVPRPLILPQSRTEALLSEVLRRAGGEVDWNTELCGIELRDTHVEASLADGSRVRCRYLVSCEGAHSRVRQWCGIKFEGATYPHDFVMADLTMDTALPREFGHSFLHPHGVVAMMALPTPGAWRLFFEAGSARMDEVTLDGVRRMYVERTGDAASVLRDPTWLTRFKIHARVVDRFRCGRVFLAGDAAHLHSPSGGQGIVTGMQDATNLVFKLGQVLQHGAPDALLDTYHEERHPAACRVLDTTDRNTRMLFAEGAAAKWFRNHVFMPVFDWPPVQQHILGRLSQLQVHYRDASLAHATSCWRAFGVKPGERAPDVVLRAGERSTTLFALLGRGRVVALLGRANPALEASLTRLGMVVHPLAGVVARRLYGGSESELCLIRPDGFVLARCDVARAQWLPLLRKLWSEEELSEAFGAPAADGGRRWLPA